MPGPGDESGRVGSGPPPGRPAGQGSRRGNRQGSSLRRCTPKAHPTPSMTRAERRYWHLSGTIPGASVRYDDQMGAAERPLARMSSRPTSRFSVTHAAMQLWRGYARGLKLKGTTLNGGDHEKSDSSYRRGLCRGIVGVFHLGSDRTDQRVRKESGRLDAVRRRSLRMLTVRVRTAVERRRSARPARCSRADGTPGASGCDRTTRASGPDGTARSGGATRGDRGAGSRRTGGGCGSPGVRRTSGIGRAGGRVSDAVLPPDRRR